MNLTGKQNYWILLSHTIQRYPQRLEKKSLQHAATDVMSWSMKSRWVLMRNFCYQGYQWRLATEWQRHHSQLAETSVKVFLVHYGSLTVSLCWSSFLQWNQSTSDPVSIGISQALSDDNLHFRMFFMIFSWTFSQANFKDGDEVSSLRRVEPHWRGLPPLPF